MKTLPHNPNYKLIAVNIGSKEFVYGETNAGDNKGLEVYYYNKPNSRPYSRRFTGRQIPMIYHELNIRLSKMVDNCPAGHKLYLDQSELPNFN